MAEWITEIDRAILEQENRVDALKRNFTEIKEKLCTESGYLDGLKRGKKIQEGEE